MGQACTIIRIPLHNRPSVENTNVIHNTVVPAVETVVKKEQLMVFPNPANEIVNFSFVADDNSKSNIVVSDMVGKTIATVFHQQTDKGKRYFASLDVHDLSQGVYIIHYRSGNTTITQKLIIAR